MVRVKSRSKERSYMKKLPNIRYLIIFALLLVISLFFWARPTPSAWLTGWLYREPIRITERGGYHLQDYQVKVVLRGDTFDFEKCEPGGRDIRFTDKEGDLLSFWIESWPDNNQTSSQSSATVWVKIPEIKPNEEKTIYLYYGNSLANSYSNFAETMESIEIKKVLAANSSPQSTNSVNFSGTYRHVLLSPPSFNDEEPLVSRLEYGKPFRVKLFEPSTKDNVHTTETVFAMGLNPGRYTFSDGSIIEVLTLNTTKTSGPFISENKEYLNYSTESEDVFLFSSLSANTTENAQERFANPRIHYLDGLEAAISLKGEYDNTDNFSEPSTITAVRFIPSKKTTRIFNLDTKNYTDVKFLTTSTASFETTVPLENPESSLIFLSSQSNGDYEPFLRYKKTTGTADVIFQYDSTAPTPTTSPSSKIQAVVFSSQGRYPVAKYVPQPPLVRFTNITGTVFEDIDSQGDEFEKNDRPKSGVKVRLFEDTNNNGYLDDKDIFVQETTTDENGSYCFPAAESRAYIVAVSSNSIAKSDAENLLPEHSASEILPEQSFVREYLNGSFFARSAFGGNNPFISDSWDKNPLPSKNSYQHTARVEIESEESVSGIDFGFSYQIIVNTKDFQPGETPIQGSFRQFLRNSNALNGKQKAVFSLIHDDPNYNEVLDEYEITPVEKFPAISDPVVIDADTQKNVDGATVLFNGKNLFGESCFNILAPDTRIQNVRIASFSKGISVATHQYSREYSTLSSNKLNSLIPLQVEPEDLSLINNEKIDIYNPDRPNPLTTIKADGQLSGMEKYYVNSSQITSMVVLAFGENFKAGKNVPFSKLEQNLLLPGSSRTEIYASSVFENSTIYNGEVSYSLDNNLRLYSLDPKMGAVRLNSKNKSLLLKNHSGLNFASHAHSGKNFIVRIFPEDRLLLSPFKEATTSARLTGVFERDVESSMAVEVPYDKTFSTTQTIIINSEHPVVCLIKRSDGDELLAYPSNSDITGIYSNDSYIISEKDGSADIFASNTNGDSIHVSVNLTAGLPFYLSSIDSLKSLLNNSKYAALHILSSSKISGYGLFNTGKSIPFIPTEVMGSSHVVPAYTSQAVAVALDSSTATVQSSSGIIEFRLDGRLNKPGISVVNEKLRPGDTINTEVPSLIIFKKSSNEKFVESFSNLESVDIENLLASSSELDSFKSNILIENCTFLANTTAVIANSGSGIEILKNRFIGNGFTIDIGNNGRDIIDSKLNIHQTNRGMDYPELTSAILEGEKLTIEGRIGTETTSTFDGSNVEIFLSDMSGQPTLFLAETEVKDGKFKAEFDVSGYSISSRDFIVASASYQDGSTSELSEPLRVDPPPVISNVEAVHILPNSDTTPQPTVTTITWFTDIPGTSKVVYDTISHPPTETYAYETTEDATLVTTHVVNIYELDIDTVYYFRAVSKNEFGDEATSHEYVIPPGRAEADTDLCAFCHRAHTAISTPTLLPYIRE